MNERDILTLPWALVVSTVVYCFTWLVVTRRP